MSVLKLNSILVKKNNIFFSFLFQPALPKVIDDDEDMDYEDEEEFMDHGHSLLDELELHFTSQEEMNKIV